MSLSLSEFRRQSGIKLMEALLELKTKHGVNDFQNTLEDIQHNFLILTNSFEIKIGPELQVKNVAKEGEIDKIKVGNFVLSICEGITIDVEDRYRELAKVFVNVPAAKAMESAQLLWDYDSRCCDFCGLYFLSPFFETPTGRTQEEDFVMAHHQSCYEFS